MRILLFHIKGPTSFNFLKTVDNITYSSYRETCTALQLLRDDNYIIDTLNEAI